MTNAEISDKLKYTSTWDGWDPMEIEGLYTSDLLSDVMANASEGEILLTIQAHKNTVAVAVLKDFAGILICSGRRIPEDMIEAAKEEGIPLFVTEDNQYTAGWKLHELTGL